MITTLGCVASLILNNYYNSQKSELGQKVTRRFHLLFCYASAVIILTIPQQFSIEHTTLLALLVIGWLGNPALLVGLVIFPFSSYSKLKSLVKYQTLSWIHRKELMQSMKSNKGKSFKEISKDITTILNKKKSESPPPKPTREGVIFRNNVWITRETVLIIILALFFYESSILKPLLKFIGLSPVAYVALAMGWLLILGAVWKGIKNQVMLSGLANRISEAKDQIDAWIKGLDPSIKFLVDFVFSALVYGILRKRKLDVSGVSMKVDKFFGQVDVSFDYLLNAVRLFPLFNAAISFVFRILVISLIFGSLISISSGESKPILIGLELAKSFFGGSESLPTSVGGLDFLVTNLHILAWIAQFSIFTLLATTFSISITHLSEKSVKFYQHYRAPIHARTTAALKGISTADINRMKKNIVAMIEKSGNVKNKDEIMQKIEEVEEGINKALREL